MIGKDVLALDIATATVALLALAGSGTQIGLVLFVSHQPKWQRLDIRQPNTGGLFPPLDRIVASLQYLTSIKCICV
jgi:hypothetical protein